MTVYLYETIPQHEGDAVKHYEIEQLAADVALVRHPETGERIRRIIVPGMGPLTKDVAPPQGGCGCGPSGCC
jgi:hypothetical protein